MLLADGSFALACSAAYRYRGPLWEKRFSQSEIEAIAAALGDTSQGLTGSEIGHILATLKMADPTPDMTKWKRLHNAFVERQNYSQNRRAILEFIRQAVKPERYAKYPERFEPMRANVNRALAFSGLAVDAAGQIYPVDRAKTLSERIYRGTGPDCRIGSCLKDPAPMTKPGPYRPT
jgi:hypothetical protein